MASIKKQAKETAVEEKPVEKVATAPEPKMYVGPTLSKLGLIQNVVYTGIPAGAAAVIAERPMVGNLFILVKDYPKAEKSIREQSGLYWMAYNEAQSLR